MKLTGPRWHWSRRQTGTAVTDCRQKSIWRTWRRARATCRAICHLPRTETHTCAHRCVAFCVCVISHHIHGGLRTDGPRADPTVGADGAQAPTAAATIESLFKSLLIFIGMKEIEDKL
jgi:hypothetical protein